MLKNKHIDRLSDNAENIELQGFFEQRIAGRACQQDTRQQGIIHSNNFYYNQAIGLLGIHIYDCGVDSFFLDNINEILGIFGHKQVNTPWFEYMPQGLRPGPARLGG